MVFSLHLVYVSTAACISEKKIGSILAQGFLRVKGQAQITKYYFLWVGAINMQSLSGHYLMRQQVPIVFSLHLCWSQYFCLHFWKKKSWVHVSLLSRLGFWFVCERPHRFCFAKPLANFLKGIMLKSFQYEMRAIFTESLIHETFYWSNETHIIHNLKPKIGIEWNFGNKLFSFIYFFHLC